jgi:tRNA A-37 threonylcarbamoyl transferase component Bud32
MLSYWTKTVAKDKAYTEAQLQDVSARLGYSPRILSVVDRKDSSIIRMERVDGHTLSDKYGDLAKDIPELVWNKIRTMISALYDEGVEYVDITPYNFMEIEDGNIKIIDFGDAKYSDGQINWFLEEFLEGLNEWNPDFK